MHRETVFAAAVVILSVFVQSKALPGFVDSLQRNIEVRNNSEVIIKNKRSGLVLGVDEFNYVVAQQFNGSQAQIWIQEPYDGKWTFMNKANGRFLDVIDLYEVSCGLFLITRDHTGRSGQHWLINPDGTIVSSFLDGIYAIDMTRFTPGSGNRIIVSILEEDSNNQIFDLVVQ